MTKLENYLEDGANYQARATLMFLQRNAIEGGWNVKHKMYEAEIQVSRWENCREQGYIISLKNKAYIQLNIAFFEHRNSDSICAVKWEQQGANPLTIGNAKFNGVYRDKYDVSHSVGHGMACEMTDWIINELKEHWVLGP